MTREQFSIFYVLLMIAICLQRIVVSFRERGTIKGSVKYQWTFPALMLTYSAILAGSVAEFFLAKWSLHLWVSVAGLVIFAGSLIVRTVAIRTLGKFWSLHIEIRKEHQLVTSGIYGVVRHPIYLSVILEAISIPLIGNAWLTILGACLVYFPVLFLRWKTEEQAMVEKFGQEYLDYKRRVPAVVPFLRLP